MKPFPQEAGPIGIFDSGYGGLTILKEIQTVLPQYDYLYLGDNARTPYGTRSFETIYEYTRESVHYLFSKGCHLVILACNTASAKALRNIQQHDLPLWDKNRRVLGVIRPSVETIPALSHSKHIGILGTTGTVQSNSYPLEIKKLYPDVNVFQQACPMWVPLVENDLHESPGAEYFIQKDVQSLLRQSSKIDTLILACTHYPFIAPTINKLLKNITLVTQGKIVADSLKDYLYRHPDMAEKCRKGEGLVRYITTEQAERFNTAASLFLGKTISAKTIKL